MICAYCFNQIQQQGSKKCVLCRKDYPSKELFKYDIYNIPDGIPLERLQFVLPLVCSTKLENIKEFMELGLTAHKSGMWGFYPIHLASKREIAEYLVQEKQVDFNILRGRDTPLHWAAKLGFFDVVQFYVERGADVNVKNSKGESALMLSATNGHHEIVQCLIFYGANLKEIRIKDGATPLLMAVRNNFIDTVKVLVLNGAEVNRTSKKGKTAFYISCEIGNYEIVKFLQKHGADVCKLFQGKSPLDIALDNSHYKIANLLIENAHILKTSKPMNRMLSYHNKAIRNIRNVNGSPLEITDSLIVNDNIHFL